MSYRFSWTARQQLRRRILLAFPASPRPDCITLHEAELIDCDWHPSAQQRAAARQLDTDHRWIDVPQSWLAECGGAWSFLDDAGKLYYLPAVLSLAVTDNNAGQFGIVNSLDSSDKSIDFYRTHLNRDQRQLVALCIFGFGDETWQKLDCDPPTDFKQLDGILISTEYWMEQRELQQQLRRVFPPTPRPNCVTLHEGELIYRKYLPSETERQQARSADRDSTWTDIHDEWLSECRGAWQFLDDAGKLYYLPAVLSRALRDDLRDYWICDHAFNPISDLDWQLFQQHLGAEQLTVLRQVVS